MPRPRDVWIRVGASSPAGFFDMWPIMRISPSVLLSPGDLVGRESGPNLDEAWGVFHGTLSAVARAQLGTAPRFLLIRALLGRTANPEAPNEVNVSRPSDLLTARAAAAGRSTASFSGSAWRH
jgi:hypothetical protein